MGADLKEARARRAAGKPRAMDSHPIAAIQKRVIHSEAYAHLPASAIAVLLLLACNLEKGRNGHVFVSVKDAEKHGIERKTLYRHLRTLVSTGFIYPTTRGGNGVCSTYALTWLPLSKDTRGLHVDGFVPGAWRDWQPSSHNDKCFSGGGKMSTNHRQKRAKTLKSMDKNGQRLGDKKGHLELNTNTQCVTQLSEGNGNVSTPVAQGWIPAHSDDLDAYGMAGMQPLEALVGGTPQ